MSCESKMTLAALAARFTWSLIRRCNDEWTCSSRLEALPKTHKGRLVWETSTNKIYHVAQERILICLMFSQLQCHETAINLMMHMFTRLTHQRHLFFWLGRCSSTVAVAFLLQGVGNVLPQLSGKDSGPLQSSPESNFASGQFIRRITLARHSL